MSTKEEPGVAPEKKEGEEQINIRVKQQADDSDVFFKIKRNTNLKKLMDAYCTRKGVNPQYVRFLFDGVRIHGDKSPNDYNMEDNDQIEVMVEQIGGY
eukprot:gene7244-8421_t